MLKIEEIKELIKLIDESSIDEFTYEADGEKVKMRKQKEEIVQASQQPIQPPVPKEENSASIQQEPRKQDMDQVNDTPKEEASSSYDHEILSPMVGTFYSSPKPESDPFVTKGAQVEQNTVVCMIEAMKLFNEIEAEVNGEVVEILAENGELVEFGQPLFRVKSK